MYNTIYILIVCTLGGFKVTISYSRAVSFLQIYSAKSFVKEAHITFFYHLALKICKIAVLEKALIQYFGIYTH